MPAQHRPHPGNNYLGLGALVLIFLAVAGCVSTSATGPPEQQTVTRETTKPSIISSPMALASLKKAQDLFNEAVKSDQPAVAVPASSLQKYQQVADMVEKEVLGKVGKSQEIGAYAILSFSQWRLGNCSQAMEAGNKGRQLYETEKLATNPRDYGMCLMVEGLCAASQTYKEYANLKGPLSKEMAQNLTARLDQAMRAINSGNVQMDRQSDIAIYTNQWQLAMVDAAVRIWTSGLPHEVWQPEVCRWLGRAGPVLAKFPATSYPNESVTLAYKKKFEEMKAAECQGGSIR